MELNEDQKHLIENLARIKEYWTAMAVKKISPNYKLRPTESKEYLESLRQLFNDNTSIEAFRAFQYDIITGVMHSVMVMIDGGDALADKVKIDIINEQTKKSLKDNVALHEEFIGFLVNRD